MNTGPLRPDALFRAAAYRCCTAWLNPARAALSRALTVACTWLNINAIASTSTPRFRASSKKMDRYTSRSLRQ